MHTMIRRIRKLKIEKRLRTFFFLASIVPVLILGICSAVRSYEEMKGMAVEYSAAMAEFLPETWSSISQNTSAR